MFKRLLDSATDGAKSLVSSASDAVSSASDAVELAKIGKRLQSLVSAENFAKWAALAESMIKATGDAACSVKDAPGALKKLFDPAHLSTMWNLIVRVSQSVISLRSTIASSPAVAEPLKEVLASIRALRAVDSAEDAEVCIRDLETKLKSAKAVLGQDAGIVNWLIDQIIEGLAAIMAKGVRVSGDFLVSVALWSIDSQLEILELILSFVLE